MISKGIGITYKNIRGRSYDIGASHKDIPNSQFLCCWNIKYTEEVIRELKRALEGVYDNSFWGGYEWGDEQIDITSTSTISHLKNSLYEDKILPDVPTIWLLELMEEWLNFQLAYSDKSKLRNLIKNAYIMICSDLPKYKRWESSSSDYLVVIDEINVGLQLIAEDGDCTLDADEYVSQIRGLQD